MTKLIVVLGATGNQGGSVVAKFLSEPDWKVRGITRNGSSEAAKKLAEQGVEVVEADLDNRESFEKVFRGANAIFAVTDFWGPFMAAYPELSQKSPSATGQHALEIEVRRGKIFVDAAAKVLKDEGKLEHFIWSSLPSCKDLSGGKYTFAYHFDAKAEIDKYIKTSYPDLSAKTSILYMGFYATNDVEYPFIRGPFTKENDGSYTWSRVGPLDLPAPFVDPKDTGTFALLLTRHSPGIKLLGAGELISNRSFANLWADRLGIRINVRQRTIEEADTEVPGGLGREMAESAYSGAEFGWGTDLVLPQNLDPNVPVTSMKEYINGEDRYNLIFPELEA